MAPGTNIQLSALLHADATAAIQQIKAIWQRDPIGLLAVMLGGTIITLFLLAGLVRKWPAISASLAPHLEITIVVMIVVALANGVGWAGIAIRFWFVDYWAPCLSVVPVRVSAIRLWTGLHAGLAAAPIAGLQAAFGFLLPGGSVGLGILIALIVFSATACGISIITMWLEIDHIGETMITPDRQRGLSSAYPALPNFLAGREPLNGVADWQLRTARRNSRSVRFGLTILTIATILWTLAAFVRQRPEFAVGACALAAGAAFAIALTQTGALAQLSITTPLSFTRYLAACCYFPLLCAASFALPAMIIAALTSSWNAFMLCSAVSLWLSALWLAILIHVRYEARPKPEVIFYLHLGGFLIVAQLVAEAPFVLPMLAFAQILFIAGTARRKTHVA